MTAPLAPSDARPQAGAAAPRPSRRGLAGLVLVVLLASGASQWWVGHNERRTGREVAALARAGDIHMLSSETCGVCAAARAWFVEHGIAFSECSIERDAACRSALEASGAPGTPVIVVRGRPQLGFSPERLRASLQQARG